MKLSIPRPSVLASSVLAAAFATGITSAVALAVTSHDSAPVQTTTVSEEGSVPSTEKTTTAPAPAPVTEAASAPTSAAPAAPAAPAVPPQARPLEDRVSSVETQVADLEAKVNSAPAPAVPEVAPPAAPQPGPLPVDSLPLPKVPAYAQPPAPAPGN